HCAVLILHHLTKAATRGYQPERFADSTQILASANAHFFMERHDPKANERSEDSPSTAKAATPNPLEP
ncbi:MAG: hypothetical protein ACOYON_01645, partial [Fimbriimonas sp.]